MIGRATLSIMVVAGILGAPLPATAQAQKAVRVGVLRPAPDDEVFRQSFGSFRQALRETGFLEGANLTIEWRVRTSTAEEMNALAAELVRRNVDAILAVAPMAVIAAARATKSIPIVAVDLETDPKAAGFAASLARPGGNVTGLFLDVPELSGKWIQLLKEAVPRLSRIAVLWDPATGPPLLQAAESASQALKVQLAPLEVRGPAELPAAFASAVAGRAQAVLVLSSPVFHSARRQIAELAAKHSMPAIMPFPDFATDGGLMAYGPHVGSLFHQAGVIMAKVLRGARPGTIPIEQPARFDLVVNLRTARTLGVTVPNSVLLRADQVIE